MVLQNRFNWRYLYAILIGYARVSTDNQDPAAQVPPLKPVGYERIFRGKASQRLGLSAPGTGGQIPQAPAQSSIPWSGLQTVPGLNLVGGPVREGQVNASWHSLQSIELACRQCIGVRDRGPVPIRMLPDFKRVKTRVNRELLRLVHRQIPVVAPLMQGMATFHQHEGKIGKIVRADESEDLIDYEFVSCESVLNREEMKRFDLDAILQKLTEFANQIGQAQTQRMLEVAGKAADSVGNVVHAGGELTPDKFLEVFRQVEMDFDPQTLQPAPGRVWVMHPDTAASVVPKVKEWEKNPAYKAEYERIMAVKRGEWRDREANRKLVS